jgi:hypothetical protein
MPPSDSSIVPDPSISDHKSFHSLVKQTFGFRNQSLSTVCTTREPDSSSSFAASPTPRRPLCSVSLSSLEDEAESSLPSTPLSSLIANPGPNRRPRPGSRPSPVYAVPPSPPLDNGDSPFSFTSSYPTGFTPTVESFSPPTLDRMGIVSHSLSGIVTAKGKKGMLSIMTDFLNSNKRPKISTPVDPIHVAHVGVNWSTGEYTGLPEKWQQLIQEGGISKSD